MTLSPPMGSSVTKVVRHAGEEIQELEASLRSGGSGGWL